MRHLITIVVLWTQGYLFAPELLQLPALFIHYQEHRDLNEAIGFEEFLVLHYSDHDHGAEPPREHDQLPFHHHHGAAIDHCCLKLVSSEPERPVSFPDAATVREQVELPKDGPLPGFLRTLLQPPRLLA
jgi:hypothetical protein